MQACDNPQIQAPPRREFSFDAAVTGLAFLSDGALAGGLGDGSVRLVAPGDTASPRTVQPHREGAAVLSMSLDIDGAGVVTGGDDGRVARTDAGGEVTVLAEFAGQQADVLAVSRSGGLRAAAGGREVRLLDRAGETVGAAADHPSTVTGLAFNPKGKRLAISHYAGATLRWTGRSIREPLSSNGEARISASPGARMARRCLPPCRSGNCMAGGSPTAKP
jgi:WD40 repeat protein